MSMQNDVAEWFVHFQSEVCEQLVTIDPGNNFIEDKWLRPGGGGGTTRILSDGKIFERGGVNFSLVHGLAPEYLRNQFSNISISATTFFATGVSIVIHPVNPFVPIIHMNIRYFEMGETAWFGGGIDLTPHYIIIDDAVFFHTSLKKMCDQFDPAYFPEFKKNADEYFFLKHRNESRGIGGIFFDQLEKTKDIPMTNRFDFVKATGKSFFPVYSELIRRNKDRKFNDNEIQWQQLRRGRYVEFNLIHDKGTKFGLETDGRTESILMSLPPLARWKYNFNPEKGSGEAQTLSLLKRGIDWVNK